MSQQKAPVNLYSTSQLKGTSDDHVPVVMAQAGYQRDHSLENFRLLIGYLSIAVAGVCAYFDYYVGFYERFLPIAMCVVVYTGLSGVYQFWVWYVEKGLVYHGNKNGVEVIIRSKSKKYSAEYSLDVEVLDKNERPLGKKAITGSFTDWFDNRGFIVFSKFSKFILDSIPAETEKKSS